MIPWTELSRFAFKFQKFQKYWNISLEFQQIWFLQNSLKFLLKFKGKKNLFENPLSFPLVNSEKFFSFSKTPLKFLHAVNYRYHYPKKFIVLNTHFPYCLFWIYIPFWYVGPGFFGWKFRKLFKLKTSTSIFKTSIKKQ